MSYIVDLKDGKWTVSYRGASEPIIKDASIDEVYIELATIIEYDAKLSIVRLLMTFPHGFMTEDGKKLERDEAVKDFDQWFSEVSQHITDSGELYEKIDQKIHDLLIR